MRVSEVYASVQGEGPRTGQMTVFVRFGGCNLRCPGWPCDTEHAVDPAYRKEWLKQEPGLVYTRTLGTANMVGARLITLTGGEPFLQKDSELQEYVFELRQTGFKVEAFTNGTLEYPDWAVQNVSMIMDWKLPGSGEDCLNQNRIANLKRLSESRLQHAVKFVIKDEDDFFTARALYAEYAESAPNIIWYYGRVWDSEMTNARLAELVMLNRLQWRMNVQLHNYIWPANERGR